MPPTSISFSRTVTGTRRRHNCTAAVRPAGPAPITTTWWLGPVGLNDRNRLAGSCIGDRPLQPKRTATELEEGQGTDHPILLHGRNTHFTTDRLRGSVTWYTARPIHRNTLCRLPRPPVAT